MYWKDCNFITLRDVYVAYRKAKKEAFIDPNSAHGLKFVAYEENLAENLETLLSRLNSGKWSDDISFIGTYTYIPKSIDSNDVNAANNSLVHFCATDPLEDWKRIHGETNKSETDYRLIIDATTDYMIVSALWVLKVGHKYDACLDSRFAVGNRLRRLRPSKGAPAGTVGVVNEKSHSLFAPYFSAYGSWRQRGLQAMKSELEKDHHIVAVTMDLKRFYHYIDPAFLLHPCYLDTVGLTLTTDEISFTKHLLTSIHTWRNNTDEKDNNLGIPVGLSASSVIANVLLNEFDGVIREELMPVYYGRYVDDIFLVLRPGEKFTRGEDFLKWLAKRLSNVMDYSDKLPGPKSGPGLTLKLSYAGKSKLIFVGKKQKIFQLEGKSGLDLIHPIIEQIRSQASEHRLLPELPEDEAGMAMRSLLVTPDATLEADALRKADVVTLRRAGFALLLSEIEAHSRDLEPNCWRDRRREFYGLAERHLVTPRGVFDYFRYIPRTLGLMVASRDWEEAESFIYRLRQVIELIKMTTKTTNGNSTSCWINLNRRIQEAILQAYPAGVKNFPITNILKALHAAIPNMEDELHTSIDPLELADRLKMADWGRTSYAQLWIESKLPTGIETPPLIAQHIITRRYLKLHIIEWFRTQANLQPTHWPALAFPTRPISLASITMRLTVNNKNLHHLKRLSAAFRGAWMPASHGLILSGPPGGTACPNGPKCPNGPSHVNCPKCPNEYRHLFVPESKNSKIRVAVTNFETTDKQWLAAVRDEPDLSFARYERLQKLLNHVMHERPRPSYVVLPECSLPRKWMMPIAQKLAINHISLLAGLEYERAPGGVKNEALVSLTTNFSGYPAQFCLTQSKLAPAWAEENHVREKLGVGIIRPDRLFRPIYVHKGFHFGLLLCSDLTDIRNRSHFQGWVDALFVLEWNQDLNTFSSLVESGALDLHAFVIQANNRQYGDSRIRGPFREEHKRDIVRVKGGVHDYYVIGEIQYKPLRDFQSAASPDMSGNALFKPFPIGFEISPQRRVGKP